MVAYTYRQYMKNKMSAVDNFIKTKYLNVFGKELVR